jgi:hypothetical protein
MENMILMLLAMAAMGSILVVIGIIAKQPWKAKKKRACHMEW